MASKGEPNFSAWILTCIKLPEAALILKTSTNRRLFYSKQICKILKKYLFYLITLLSCPKKEKAIELNFLKYFANHRIIFKRLFLRKSNTPKKKFWSKGPEEFFSPKYYFSYKTKIKTKNRNFFGSLSPYLRGFKGHIWKPYTKSIFSWRINGSTPNFQGICIFRRKSWIKRENLKKSISTRVIDFLVFF